jgi:transposase
MLLIKAYMHISLDFVISRRHNYIIILFKGDIIIEGGRRMTLTQKPDNDKPERLKQYGAFNPHPDKVTEELFLDAVLDFFDPRDLIQVKYEMLRAVDKEGRSVKQASQSFGFSRPAFYQAESKFKEGGVTGLIKKRPGPKSAHKLTAEVLAFIEENTEEGQPLRARKLAPLLRGKFGKDVHPRSIERAIARRKKKKE